MYEPSTITSSACLLMRLYVLFADEVKNFRISFLSPSSGHKCGSDTVESYKIIFPTNALFIKT
jgi:hypothetical protein